MTREEMMIKAKEANSAEELIALAKENNVEASDEEIRAYYESTHIMGELTDDELDNVSGGRCYKDGRPVVLPTEIHTDCYTCECGEVNEHYCERISTYSIQVCGNCKWCVYEKKLYLCTNPGKCK